MLIVLPSANASRLLLNLHNSQSRDTGKASIAVHTSSVLPVSCKAATLFLKPFKPYFSLSCPWICISSGLA